MKAIKFFVLATLAALYWYVVFGFILGSYVPNDWAEYVRANYVFFNTGSIALLLLIIFGK